MIAFSIWCFSFSFEIFLALLIIILHKTALVINFKTTMYSIGQFTIYQTIRDVVDLICCFVIIFSQFH